MLLNNGIEVWFNVESVGTNGSGNGGGVGLKLVSVVSLLGLFPAIISNYVEM